MTMTPPRIDAAKAEAFAARMLDTLNASGLALMTSLGHRTGLFDAMAGMPPATSAEIAAKTGLNERYVREWLGAMVAGRVVESDPEAGTYRLPVEHAAWLTRSARPNNLAVPMQWVGVLGAVESLVADAFWHGNGVPYSAYARFHEVMAEESDQTTVAGLFDHILPIVPCLLERLSAGIDVLDVGCGRGKAMLALAGRYPASRFAGYDFSKEAVAAARAEARTAGLRNVRFEAFDVAKMTDTAAYDLVTAFDAIHDQADPAAVLRNIARSLRPGGTFLMQDIRTTGHAHRDADLPLGPMVYAISCMHCMSVSLACKGAGLGAAWGREKAQAMLADAGFANVARHELPHDILNDYYVATR